MYGRTIARNIPLIAACTVVLWLYGSTFRALSESWIADGNCTHGFAVVPAVICLFYARRKSLAAIQPVPSFRGSLLLGFGLFALLVGIWADAPYIAGASLPLVVAGMVWAFAGPWYLKELAFPIAFLLFMVPPPDVFTQQVVAPLQRFSCAFSAGLASLIGLDVRAQGVLILTNGMTFAVDAPCSGIRAMYSLGALTAILAYLSSTTPLRRLVVFLLAVPLALAANVLRILGVIVVADVDTSGTGVPAFHFVSGPVALALAVGLALLVKRRLECLRNDNCPV